MHYNAKVAGGTPATADLRGWWDTNRNLVNENFIFRQVLLMIVFFWRRLQVFVSRYLL